MPRQKYINYEIRASALGFLGWGLGGLVPMGVELTYPRAVYVCGDRVDVDESAPGGDE